MDNNPLTPSLESSTMNLEKDLKEATVESLESFVITEEEPISESKDIKTDPEKIAKAHDVMTQSKYAQVVFLEISDRYPNDSDILCNFTYNLQTTGGVTSDRIGLYRVPFFAPHEYLAFSWVSDAKDGTDGNFCVNFKALGLPKEEDFYQFQFLRTDEQGRESAIGASIPFQLQAPKSEELCTVEDDEEFMVVRSRTALVTEKMGQMSSNNLSLKDKLKDMETKHRKLLDLSELLQSDLEKKSEAYLIAETQLTSLNDERTKLDQLKTDLACVLQDKVLLEEKLHRHQKALRTLQMDRDLLAGERNQAIREKDLLAEERNQVMKKSEEFKDMTAASTKAKDLAVAEVRKFILKSDEQQRTIQNLDVRVKEIEKLNHDLVLVNNDQKAMIANLQEHSNQIKARLAEMEFEKNMKIEELQSTLDEQKLAKDTELDEVKAKLQRKEKEFEVLTQEMFERSKSKFREIDVLKKKLSEAERNLNKFVEFGPPTTIHEASRIIESWKIPDWVKVDDIEQFKSLCEIHCQHEEEVREMTELRRQLKDKKPERPVVLPIQNLLLSKPKSEAETQTKTKEYFTKDQIAKLDENLCLFGCKYNRNEAHPSCKVAIRSHHGKYVGAEPYGSLGANKSEIGDWEIWNVTFVGKEKVTFKSAHQKYLRAELDGKAAANRITAGNCEKFSVKIAPGKGKFSFKSYHGTYLVAEWPSGKMNANRRVADLWETFSVIPIADPNTEGDMETYSLDTRSLESAEENSVMSKLSEIEATVKQTQKEMQEYINFSQANSATQSEIQSVRSHDSSTFTDSSLTTNDSRRLMDYQVIQQALHEPHVDHQPDTASTCAADLSGLSPLKRRLNQMMDGFREIEDSPKIQQVYTGTKPKSKESTPTNIVSTWVNSVIPTAPPTNDEAAADDVILDVVKTTSPLIERSQNVLFKFLPQLSQSVFGNLEETMMLKPCSASATPEEATPERDIPIVVQEQPKIFVNEDQDQFTDLVNWQKASIVSTVTEEGIVLTDDGRTMTEEEAKPRCPICEETFDVDDVKTLEMHVEAHLATNLYCPVCNAAFGIDKRENYQNHVQEHFADTDTDDEPTQNTGNSWFMDFD
jgi:hypothetical protein